MRWEDRVKATFAQKELFSEVGGGAGGSRPWLPTFRKRGPTAGVLQGPGKPDTELVSGGKGGPASRMPAESPGFDAYTRRHVEGHAAAVMREEGMSRGTLYINHPAGPCSSCGGLLNKMLPSGARLDIFVVPTGVTHTFFGVP